MFELVAVVCLIAVLAGVGNNRLRYYQELAEKAVMDLTLAAMTAGLRYRVAGILINSSVRSVVALERINPVSFLQDPPRGYMGEFLAPEVNVEAGSWYYDSARFEIVYVPALTDHLAVDGGGAKLRFRVKLMYDRPVDVTVSNDQPMVVGVRMEPAVNYKWF